MGDKLKGLLEIAQNVQQSGKRVTAALVEKAKAQGATDREIHDTVLIAALFCLYNKYVDGLAGVTPDDPADPNTHYLLNHPCLTFKYPKEFPASAAW